MASYGRPFRGEFKVSSQYLRQDPRYDTTGPHRGVDLVALDSDYIYSIAPGTVSTAKYDDKGWGYGYYVTIDHDGGGSSLYAHMSGTPHVSVGQKVTTDTILGIMGNSGTGNGGRHLHFEVSTSNPWNISRSYITDPCAAIGIQNVKGSTYVGDGTIQESPPVNTTNSSGGTSGDYGETPGSYEVSLESGAKVLVDTIEILPNLDSQPYHAFVDMTFGGHQFPNIPPKYLQNLTVQILSESGITVSLVLLDEMGDEIEELLQRSASTDNTIRFGHVSGRQSNAYKVKFTTYSINFTASGTVLTIMGVGETTAANFQRKTYHAGNTPSDAVKTICDKEGWTYNDNTIEPSEPVTLDDGTIKEFNLIKDNPIDFIHKEISPYAIKKADGTGGYQFYLDETTQPATAHFHPIEISGDVYIRTYVFQKGINTNVISFIIETDFVVNGSASSSGGSPEGDTNLSGITSVTEVNHVNTMTKEETNSEIDINDSQSNVNGEYGTIDSDQSKESALTSGMSFNEATNSYKYRMTLAQKSINASLTIVGDPTIKIGDEIRVIHLTKPEFLHHTSGKYNVMEISHSISSGIMTTILNITKIGDIEGPVQIKNYKNLYR